MGFLDDAENLLGEGEQLAKEHPDQVKEALGKVEGFADQETGGQFNDEIKAAGDQAEGFLSN